MKIYIWIIQQPSQEYGKKSTGARLTVCANDDAEARRLLEEMMPKGLTVDAILFRKIMHEAKPIVFEAANYAELVMNDGRKTHSFIHGQRVGLT